MKKIKLNKSQKEMLTAQVLTSRMVAGLDPCPMNEQKPIEDIVRFEYEKGNIVFWDCDNNLVTANLQDFIKQPIDGILYDLNRSEEVILTFINDPKWINDYAVCKVIRKLKERIEELEKKLLTFTSKTT